MHQTQARDRYQLRNDAHITFKIEVSTQGKGVDGATTRATIHKNDGQNFRYEVVFRGEYCLTKGNFSERMYEDTALSLVRCQLESRVYKDTRITLEVNSGMPLTETGLSFNWG